MNKYNIAIDGPAGAGKSTIARLVAKALGYIYVDTGAMYRAVTWQVLQKGLLPEQEEQVIEAAKQMRIDLIPSDEGQQVLVDGVDVTAQIRTTEINALVSRIASIGDIRTLLVAMQQRLAASKGVVMDGRDIGTHVLPDAEIKIFLTASVGERAKRRYQEMLSGGDLTMTLEQLEKEIARRDRMDEERKISPLVRAHDAILLDSTTMTIPEVVEYILGLCRDAVGGGK